MLVGEARAVAARWVAENAADCHGAFLTGSTTVLPLDATLPTTSDVDVVVVVAGEVPAKLGKIPYRGVLVEVTFAARAEVATAADLSYHLAPSFHGDHVLADPTGHLARLRREVEPVFAAQGGARVDAVLATIEKRLSALDPAAPWPELVTAWLFPTSLMAVVPVVASLGTPTVRLRYLAARALLAPSRYEELLELLGCADVSRAVVARHLDTLAAVFDRAATVPHPPFFFSADITPAARPVAIDGSRVLVGRGDHREAVFWIVATAARCRMILNDEGMWFPDMVADLVGLPDPAALLARRDRVLAALPR